MTIALNILYAKKEKLQPAYVSSNRKLFFNDFNGEKTGTVGALAMQAKSKGRESKLEG